MSLPQPALVPIPDTGNMAVLGTFSILLPVSGKTLTILDGFQTDGATIPQEAWSIIDTYPFDPDLVAAVVPHDALYEAELMERGECDRELEALMKLNSRKSMHLHWVFFMTVRALGGEVWSRHTPKSIADAKKYCSLHP